MVVEVDAVIINISISIISNSSSSRVLIIIINIIYQSNVYLFEKKNTCLDYVKKTSLVQDKGVLREKCLKVAYS